MRICIQEIRVWNFGGRPITLLPSVSVTMKFISHNKIFKIPAKLFPVSLNEVIPLCYLNIYFITICFHKHN